jgi:single-strand DNA-binding protein
MANGINKAILVGNLGKDPELRYIPSGNSVTSFPLATSETFKDKSGNRQTRTTWHNVVIWGKLAEIANQYLKKGSQVYLEGRIDNRSYDDKEGNKRYISEVVIDFNGKMLMLGSRGGSDDVSRQDAGPAGGLVRQPE